MASSTDDLDDDTESESRCNISKVKPGKTSHKVSKDLLNAISDGNFEEVKALLTQISPKQINKCVRTKNSGHNVTPLLWAVYNHQEQIAKLLIENGAQVNKQGTYEDSGIVFNYTPLLRAIENDHETMVELLIQNGANVHLKAPGPRQSEEEGGSQSYVKWMYPMNLALHMDNFNIIKMLMIKFNVTRIYDEGSHTCLCRAAMMFDTNVIQYMILRGAKMCRGEGIKNDAYSTPGICRFFKNLIQNSFSIQFMSDMGNVYASEQNNFRCLMSISLTDYARSSSMIHRAVLQYMTFADATHCQSLPDHRDSKSTKSDGGFDWLKRLSSRPSKLKHICRIKIREIMHRNLPDNIKLLPLPKQIVQYLMYESDLNIINGTNLNTAHYEDLTV